jgi:hypothetical protein
LKNAFLFASVAALLPMVLAYGQETRGGAAVVPVSFPAQQSAYSPDEIKVLGVLDIGESSKPTEFFSTPKYQAFVFQGNGHDQVEITVTGSDRKAYIALADSGLVPIASGLGRLAVALPYHGPDTEAFYILVKNLGKQPAHWAVHLKKTAAPAQASFTTTR